MIRYIILTSLLLMASAGQTFAATFEISYKNGRVERNYPEGTRPVIGLALSGGGARGFAHIGVLEVLQEHGIRIDRIAGTSMGSIVGGLYAAGYGTETLHEIIGQLDWSETFNSAPRRRSRYIGEKETSEWPLFELRFRTFRARIPSSLSSGQRIATILSQLSLAPTYECNRDFDNLRIPFRSVSTDLRTGEEVIIDSGNLGEAIRASSTIPLLFAPVHFEGRLLVDGGLKNNLPVEPAKSMGSDFVIAVAIDESMHSSSDELDNPLNVADQVTSILMRNITSLSKGRADFIISPDMDGMSSNDFDSHEEMIARGRTAALAVVNALSDSLSTLNSSTPQALIRHIFGTPALEQRAIESAVRSRMSGNGITTQGNIAEALETLWNSGRYAGIRAELDESTGILDVVCDPAPQVIEFRFDNPHEPNDQPVRTVSVPFSSAPDMKDVMAIADSLLFDTRKNGASLAHFNGSALNVSNRTLTLDIAVPIIEHIEIQEGLQSRNSLIQRELEFADGDIFNMTDIIKSVDNLYGSNHYELVTVDVKRGNRGAAVQLQFREKNWTVARFGLRYDEFFNAEGRITLTRENILGIGSNLIMSAQTGPRRQLFMLESATPRIYKSLYTINLKTYRSFRRRPIYNKQEIMLEYEDERYGTVLSVGQQVRRFGNVMLQLRTETINTRFARYSEMDNDHKEFRSIVFRSLIDSYDRYPFPKSGYMNLLFLQSTTEALGGSEQFVKLFWRFSAAKTMWRRHTLHGTLSAGRADASTPSIDAFTLGGQTMRLNCYDAHSAESHYYADFPGLAHEERIGTQLAVAKIGYRMFIPRAFYLDLTYAYGNVWGGNDTVSTDTAMQAYGVKGSLSTYFGPLSVGWGITSEGDDRTYLSAGWEF